MVKKNDNLTVHKRCIHLNEIIEKLESEAGIQREDAINNTKILFSIIKDNLIEGNNINLGELGLLTHHRQKYSDFPEIRYTPSLPFLCELREKYRRDDEV